MHYNQFIDIISNYQRSKIILGLQRISQAMQEAGNVQDQIRSIHIAGTKGKGSVAYILESILFESGLKVGLFTSPHITDFTERFRINKKNISKKKIVSLFNKYRGFIEKNKLTYFEAATLLAFVYFYLEEVDIAIYETGLGGRYDSTNILKPVLTIITPIDFDHMEYLGNDIDSIVREKSGIIKKEITNLYFSKDKHIADLISQYSLKINTASTNVYDEFKDIKVISSSLDGIHFKYKRNSFYVPLIGLHQVENALICLKAVDELRRQRFEIELSHIIDGFKSVNLSGRIELVNNNPLIILDCAHNIISFKVLKESIQYYLPGKKVNLIFGIMKDKDHKSILHLMKPIVEEAFFLTINDNRALEPETLKDFAQEIGLKSKNYKYFKNALRRAALGKNIIVITGSFKVVEIAKKYFKKHPEIIKQIN